MAANTERRKAVGDEEKDEKLNSASAGVRQDTVAEEDEEDEQEDVETVRARAELSGADSWSRQSSGGRALPVSPADCCLRCSGVKSACQALLSR